MPESVSSATLDPSVVAFITDHLSIHVAAVTDRQTPTLVRGVGCRVNDQRDRVSLLVAKDAAEPILHAIHKNGRVAAIFNQPETHRTLQLKGSDAVIETATDVDKASLDSYLKRFSERLKVFNVQENYVRTVCNCDPDNLIIIAFTPLTAFQQTPGSSAGDKMPVGGMLP